MTVPTADALVVFCVNEQEFALPVSVVERVIPAVEIAQLPGAPEGVLGVINFQGRIVPVFDLRARLGAPARPLQASDHLVLAHTRQRMVALLVESVREVLPAGKIAPVPAAEVLPHLELVSGMVKLEEGIAMVHDLDRFLSLEDDAALQVALTN